MSSSSSQQNDDNSNVRKTEAGGNRHSNNDGLTPKDIYKLLKNEIETPSLQAMEANTFQKIASMLGNLNAQDYQEIEAKIRDRMVGMLANSAQLLLEARQHKILADNEKLDYSKLT